MSNGDEEKKKRKEEDNSERPRIEREYTLNYEHGERQKRNDTEKNRRKIKRSQIFATKRESEEEE